MSTVELTVVIRRDSYVLELRSHANPHPVWVWKLTPHGQLHLAY